MSFQAVGPRAAVRIHARGVPVWGPCFLVCGMIAFGIACSAVSSDSAGISPTAREHLEAGASLHLEGRFAEAIEEYDRSIALDRHDPDAFFNRGLADAELGRFDDAKVDFDSAIRLNPAFPEALYQRASAYDDLGLHAKALTDYDRAIQLATEDSWVKYVRRDRAIAQFKLERKQRIAQGASADTEPNPKGYLERCTFYIGQARPERALEDCHAAVRIDPADPRGFYFRGYVYAQLGKFRRAIIDFDHAIRLGYEGPDALFNRGISHLQLTMPDEAVQDFDLTIKVDPKYGKAYGGRAVALTALGRYEAAQRDYEKAVELGMDAASLRYELDTVRADVEAP